jgi:hypothetical protein
MSRLIINPGNGINFPKTGDYVKISMQIKTKNNEILFNSNKINNLELRIGDKGSFVLPQIEDLITEMSLFEKCSIEINNDHINDNVNNDNNNEYNEDLKEKLTQFGKIIFEIEIIDITKSRNY